MSLLIKLLHPLVERGRALRFRAWVEVLRIKLAARGVKLEVTHGRDIRLDGFPRVTVVGWPGRGGTFRLTVEDRAWIGRGVFIEIYSGGDSELKIGDHTLIFDGARMLLRHGRMIMGSRVQIREHALLKSEGELLFDDESGVSAFSTVHCREMVHFGRDASCAEHCVIVDSDHQVAVDGSKRKMDRPVVSDPIIIGEDVFITANCVITRGANIGAHSAVAAGSLVRAGKYPSGWLLAGSPAKPRRALFADAEPWDDVSASPARVVPPDQSSPAPQG